MEWDVYRIQSARHELPGLEFFVVVPLPLEPGDETVDRKWMIRFTISGGHDLLKPLKKKCREVGFPKRGFSS